MIPKLSLNIINDETKFLPFFNRSNKQEAYTEKLGIHFLKNDATPKNDFTSEAHEGVKKFTTSSTFDASG